MKTAAEVNKEDSVEAMTVFKEQMINSREAMKQKAEQQKARGNGRDKTKGN